MIDGKPYRRNQNLVAKLLMEKQIDVVVVYNDTASIVRRNEMIKHLQFLEPNSEIVYHLKLLELFVLSCKGKVYEAEMKCQSLFSLDDILYQVSDRANWPRIKSAFIALLEEAYLVTERSLKNISQSHQIWEMLEVFIRDFGSHVNHELTVKADTSKSTFSLRKLPAHFAGSESKGSPVKPAEDEANANLENPGSTASTDVKPKLSLRKGLLQVLPSLLQPQDDANSPTKTDSTETSSNSSHSTSSAPRLLRREQKMGADTSLISEPLGRKRALSKGTSSPTLMAHAVHASNPEPTPSTSTQGDSSASQTMPLPGRGLLRRGGGIRGLAVSSDILSKNDDSQPSTPTSLQSEPEKTADTRHGDAQIDSNESGSVSTASGSQPQEEKPSLPSLRSNLMRGGRANALAEEAHPNSLAKKSVSWRGSSQTGSGLLFESNESVEVPHDSLVEDHSKEETNATTESPDCDAEVCSLPSSSSCSSSSSSSSSCDSDSEDEEAEERRAAERLAAARARDAALVNEAEMESSEIALKAEEARLTEEKNHALKRKHFFEDERDFIFNSVLPFISRCCTIYWATKRFDSNQTEKLNELVDAAFELSTISDLTPHQVGSLVHCFESMKSRGIIGVDQTKAIEKYVSAYHLSPGSLISPLSSQSHDAAQSSHLGPADFIMKRTMTVGPTSLHSSFERPSGDPLVAPMTNSTVTPRMKWRTASYMDITASTASSDDVTKGLRLFLDDCRSLLKPHHELSGLACFIKKDVLNQDENAPSMTSKLTGQLGDPAYSDYNTEEPAMMVLVLRSLRLILMEPRVLQANEDENPEELLSEVEHSFPGVVEIFGEMEKHHFDEEAAQEEKSCPLNENANEIPFWIEKALESLGSLGDALSKSMKYEEGVEDRYEVQLTEIQNKLDSLGATPVFIKLITSQSELVVQEAVRCAIALLWGGNKLVQEHILHVFQTTFHGELFFHELRSRFRKGLVEVEERRELTRKQHMEQVGDQLEADNTMSPNFAIPDFSPRAHAESGSSTNRSSEEHDENPDMERTSKDEIQSIENSVSGVDNFGLGSVLNANTTTSQVVKSVKDMKAMEELLRLLQLLCEGHNRQLQDHIRQQRHNLQSYDMVTETAVYLEALERNIDSGSVSTAIQAFNSLTEYCQGPCLENQVVLSKSKLCDSVNFLLHENNVRCTRLEYLELQISIVTTLLSLLEGAGTNPAVPRHLLSSLDLGLIEQKIKAIVQEVTDVLVKLGKTGPKQNSWTGQRFQSIFDTSDLPEDAQAQVECGYLYFFLLRTLNDYDEAGKVMPILVTFPPNNFFTSAVGSLEIVRNGEMERLYFRIPSVCSHLTANSKVDLIRNVNRTNQQEKLEDMFERSEHLLSEMEHREALSNSPKFSWIASNEVTFKNLSFVVSLLINALIIGFYTSPTTTPALADANEEVAQNIAIPDVVSSRSFSISPWVVFLMFMLAMVQLTFSGLTLFIYAVSHLPLRLRKKWDSVSLPFIPPAHKTVATSLYIVFSDTYFMYYLLYMIFALLGILSMPNAPYFFAFHLLDIVVRSELLKYVIKSVTVNGKAIMLTACLALVVVYIYSIFGFLFFRSKFSAEAGCDSMLMCLVTSINMGIRSGGGIGDIMEPPAWQDPDTHWRILYDSTFFFLVIVIMLNIIFGIIIDTFGELRTQNNEIEEDIRNKCFVCGIEREQFDRNAEGFDRHISSDHHVFHYIYFFMYLRRKERTEYTGPEQYVADLLKSRAWHFMPALRAMCLGGNKEVEAEKSEQILDGVNQLSKVTSTQLEQLKRGISKRHGEVDVKVEKLAVDAQRVDAVHTQLFENMTAYDSRLGSLEDKLERLLALMDAQTAAQNQTNLHMSKLASSTANLGLNRSSSTSPPMESENEEDARPLKKTLSLRGSGTSSPASVSVDSPNPSPTTQVTAAASPSISSSGNRSLRSASKNLRVSATSSPGPNLTESNQ